MKTNLVLQHEIESEYNIHINFYYIDCCGLFCDIHKKNGEIIKTHVYIDDLSKAFRRILLRLFLEVGIYKHLEE